MTEAKLPADDVTPEAITRFWLEAGPERWFKKDEAFDAEVAARFRGAAEAAAAGAFDDWAANPEGALALVILLDQFRRNIFRGTPEAFDADPKALAIATRAIEQGFDRALPASRRVWFYMPFEHTEDLAIQDRCVAMFEALGNPELVKWAVLHRDIIARFGRFPHRNAILGRASTPEEDRFLADGGFAG